MGNSCLVWKESAIVWISLLLREPDWQDFGDFADTSTCIMTETLKHTTNFFKFSKMTGENILFGYLIRA